ncbi:MAG TPA: hemolysin D [Sutterella sp.]|nr:hemolysin D [Sutterella sp.]
MRKTNAFGYTFGEEIANAVTHAVGVALSVAGLAVLVGLASANSPGAWVFVALAIYGASMFLLFTASTLYHTVTDTRMKRVLQIVDHSMIYVMIAGTYTPFCLMAMDTGDGIAILIAEWAMAILGIVLQGFYSGKDWYKCVIYLVMGWLIIVDVGDVIDHSTAWTLTFLIAGGVTYSLGVIFYIWDRLPYNHAIWHLFVLGACVMQYFAVLQYVI